MRYPLFVLIQMPPGDDDAPTQFGSSFVPEEGHNTQPMASPYGDVRPGIAPPPPPSVNVPWPINPPYYAPGSPQRRGTTAGIVGGIMIAFALVLLIGAGLVVAQNKLNFLGTVANSPTKTSVVNSPSPTTAPTRTPSPTATVAPTNTPQANPQLIPNPPLGFSQYVSASGIWGLDMPELTSPTYSTLNTSFGKAPTTIFNVAPDSNFTVYVFSNKLTPTQVSALVSQVVILNAPDAQIIDQGPETDGQNTWQTVQVRLTVNDQSMQTRFFYTTHGNGSVAITMSAPDDGFSDTNQSVFQEMISSFTFLQ